MRSAPLKALKPWFQTIEDVGPGFDCSELFGNSHPVVLDIGCGRGLFLVNASADNPRINYLGLEIDYCEGRRAATRLLKRKQSNARVLGGDCRIVLSKLLPPASVSAAHVYFPDPWWKTRHRKRRLFTKDFVTLLARIVQPCGCVHSWSDVAEYFDVICGLMDEHPDFCEMTAPVEREPQHDMDYRTSFERKKRRQGFPVYRGRWQRRHE